MSKTKTTPDATANGKPPAPPHVDRTTEEAIKHDRSDPRTNAFPGAGRELFATVVEKLRWHADQIEQQLRGIEDAPPESVLHNLSETAADARAIWALAWLLHDAADTGR
jgi:hypothetical protein